MPERGIVRLSLGALEVAQRAVVAPGSVVRGSAQSLLASVTRGREPVELRGPVGIVHEVGDSGASGILFMLASLAAHAWPILVGVLLFELATGAVFHATYPEAASDPRRGYRLARLHQLSLLSLSALFVTVPMLVLSSLEVPGAQLLAVWIMPAFVSAYPLLWIAGTEVWPRPSVVVGMLAAVVAPCVAFMVLLGLLPSLQRALKTEGFRFGWLRSEPPAPHEAGLPTPNHSQSW